MFELAGKKVLVTGSTQGIGYAIAKCLADRGAQVFVNGAHSEEKTIAAAQKINGAIPVTVDLSKPECAERLYAVTGDVDILVLNASVQIRKAWDQITEDEFERQIDINLKASVKLIQKYAPHMKEQRWGRIVTVGSVQQYRPHKDMLIYAASKCAQVSIVNNLAKQLAPYGITVNNISPGVIETPRNEKVLADKEYEKQVLKGIPCEYMGKPEDCAAGALLLCSEEGRYITGTDLVIDGGMHL